MAKKKTLAVTLSKEAEVYFDDVAYSLDFGGGKGPSNSQVINHCLEELALFEKHAGQSVTDYLKEGWPHLFEKSEEK